MGKPKYQSAAQKGDNQYNEDFEKTIELLNSPRGILFLRSMINDVKKPKYKR